MLETRAKTHNEGNMSSILDACDPAYRTRLVKGTTLLEQGTTSGALYVLEHGRVGVFRGPVEVAEVSEPGAVFGETSVLLNTAHTATVKTKSDCDVYYFKDAAQFIRHNPAITYEIAAILARRLDRANSFITDLNESARNAANIWAW